MYYIHTWIILCSAEKLKSHSLCSFHHQRGISTTQSFSLPAYGNFITLFLDGPFHRISFGWRCASTSSSSWPLNTMWGNDLMRWRSREVTISSRWTRWARTARSFSSPSSQQSIISASGETVVVAVRRPYCCAVAWREKPFCLLISVALCVFFSW